MAFLRQTFLTLIVLGATVVAWAWFVPSSHPYLEKVGLSGLLGLEAEGAVEAPQERRGGGGATRVTARPVETRAIDNRIEAIGDGAALRAVDLRSEVAGTVREVAVAPGSQVKAGQLIVQLDDDVQQLELQRSQLMLEKARTDRERLDRLADRGAVTSVQSQEAELALRTAELTFADAEVELERRSIRAPFDGWIGLLEVEEGDRLSAQDVLAVLADRSSILIDFRVPERAIADLKTGLPFEARPLALPGRVLTGEIVAIDNVVERNSRTLKVQGRLANADDVLRTGMAFSVALSIPGEVLPAVDPLALQWSAEGSFVWLVREGKAARVPVAIRQRNADAILVAGELSEDEMVVTEGVQSLRPGAEVEVVEGAAVADAVAPPATSVGQ
ncbi:efflux RND transporter periplasmic adaptor subunit [Oceaniglobus roseus]|uniref:efflux RND transporter periplasmic adaptor subunit n=1 Tax=Oceaniglobus roseus TaxID=1737570 RepID=UPI000C7F63B0|nr:efflux RND transporter periplasmic adaptor subunit [Kandeliimicrobium roseum]